MQTFDAVLFDLDGTLIDSAPGIFDSFEFTLAQYEMTVPQERLRRFLGPPLRESFAKLLPPDEVERAVEIYRAHYAEASGALTKLYPGTKELLSALREAGYIVCLATSKVRYAALKLLDKLELTPYFDYIGGSSPDSRGELEPFAPLYLAPSAGALRAWLLQRKDQGEAALPEKE